MNNSNKLNNKTKIYKTVKNKYKLHLQKKDETQKFNQF